MPADLTRSRRDALRHVAVQPTTHPGLWLDRFLDTPTWERGREPAPGHKDAAITARERMTAAITGNHVPAGYREALTAWRAGFAAPTAVTAEGRVLGRVAAGLGAKGVAEYALALHRTWGVPVLPGSSLKGVAAAAASRFLGPAWRHRDQAARARPGGPTLYDALFGDVEESGAVVFHDAWYLPPPGAHAPLKRDVLTVHHPDYYQQDAEPSDTDDPNPVPFVTATGAFFVALELAPGLDPAHHGAWLEAAWTALRLGLRELGVGSKTNAGYGRVELPAWATAAGRAPTLPAVDVALPAPATAAPGPATAADPRAAVEAVAASRARGEGVDGLLAWLKGRGLPRLPGLEPDEATVRLVVAELVRRGRARDLAARTHPAWRAWATDALTRRP